MFLDVRVGVADLLCFLDVLVERVEHLVRVHGAGLGSDEDQQVVGFDDDVRVGAESEPAALDERLGHGRSDDPDEDGAGEFAAEQPESFTDAVAVRVFGPRPQVARLPPSNRAALEIEDAHEDGAQTGLRRALEHERVEEQRQVHGYHHVLAVRMNEARGVDVLARVQHLQDDPQTRENRHASGLVVRVGEQHLPERERGPQRGAVEDAPVTLVLLLGVLLGHHDEDRRGSVRAHANQVVDVGGVTHAADDVAAELGAPG